MTPNNNTKGSPIGINGFMRIIHRATAISWEGLLLIWITSIIGFAGLYFLLSNSEVHGLTPLTHALPLYRLFDSVYFSIVTATTVGYGDIVPHGLSKLVVSVQAMFSMFTFLLFITRMVTEKQDIALRQIHTLTFEDIFVSTREGLFIVRKDFDHLMHALEETGELSTEAWENMTIAFKQCEALLEEILQFYDRDNELYVLDIRREQLLLESVSRTLHRLKQLLETMRQTSVEFYAHALTVKELHALVSIANNIIPLWRDQSPYQEKERFEEIMHTVTMLKKMGR